MCPRAGCDGTGISSLPLHRPKDELQKTDDGLLVELGNEGDGDKGACDGKYDASCSAWSETRQ
ncbi:MAG: hypothetical protein NVSMB31_03900 [Vulcanimicrobiaceae bacterium]